MVTSSKDFSSMTLKELKQKKEEIEDRIEIAKGRESMNNSKGYSSSEMRKILQECIKK